jgi:hypothetical protein
VQQQVGAIRAAVLRRQLLVNAGGAGLIPAALERVGAVDRGRQCRALAEARTAGEAQDCEQQRHQACDRARMHRLKSLSLAGRMARDVVPRAQAA